MDKPHTIDPATGIWPVSEWGYECARGFVSNSRFARPGDRVIERTARTKTRAWRRAMEPEAVPLVEQPAPGCHAIVLQYVQQALSR